MFTIFIRAILLYILMILATRFMGKRQMGQFQPYEFAMALLVANLLATPMADVSTPLLHGVIPIAALLAVHGIIALVCMKSDAARAFISGKPSIVVSKGVINQAEMERLCLTLSDLLEGFRQAGISDPADVGFAVMEANGTITAFPRSSMRPPTTKEIGVDAGYEGVPMALVMDGHIQKSNLKSAHLDEAWLRAALAAHGYAPDNIFLATLDTQGILTVQVKNGGIFQTEALDASEVAW